MRPLIILLITLAVVGSLLFFQLPEDPDQGPGNSQASTELASELVRDGDSDRRTGIDRFDLSLQKANEHIGAGVREENAPKKAVIGFVKSSAQQPVCDARVTLTRTAAGMPRDPNPRVLDNDVHAKTDSNGRFAFYGVLALQSYILTARHSDYSRTTIDLGEVGLQSEVQWSSESGIKKIVDTQVAHFNPLQWDERERDPKWRQVTEAVKGIERICFKYYRLLNPSGAGLREWSESDEDRTGLDEFWRVRGKEEPPDGE